MGSTANKWFCSSLLLGVLAIAGCVPVYSYSPSDPPVAGRRIKPEDVAFIKPGITSRDEVISNLGVPTVDLSDLRTLVYVWIELKEQWVGVIPGLLFTAPRTADWTLLVAIDENDRVVSSGFDQRRWSDTVISQARKWAEAQLVRLQPARTSFDPLPIPEEKALIYIYRVKPPSSFSWSWSCLLFSAACLPARLTTPSWQFPVAVAIDDQYVTEMHDETYVALSVPAGQRNIVADPLPPYRYAKMKGNLVIDPSKRRPGTITVQVSPGQQYFLEVLSVTDGFGTLNTSLTVRNESAAKPVLQTFRPVW